jgi:TetR/AcrR family transcriptional regulator, repressor for neighboring sulfatase
MAVSKPRVRGRRVAQRRRLPEAARQEILEAALRVFGDHHPEAVGLKEVAKEAGVSHALVTHYFGSFGGLVDSVLESRVVALRHIMVQRIGEPGALERPGELLATLFQALEDPVHKRLWLWALATERDAAQDFFPLRNQGLRLVAEQLATMLAAPVGLAPSVILSEVERTLVAGVSAAYGYTVGKLALVGALGKVPSREFDRGLQQSLGEMMQDHLVRYVAAQAAAASGAAPHQRGPGGEP